MAETLTGSTKTTRKAGGFHFSDDDHKIAIKDSFLFQQPPLILTRY